MSPPPIVPGENILITFLGCISGFFQIRPKGFENGDNTIGFTVALRFGTRHHQSAPLPIDMAQRKEKASEGIRRPPKRARATRRRHQTLGQTWMAFRTSGTETYARLSDGSPARWRRSPKRLDSGTVVPKNNASNTPYSANWVIRQATQLLPDCIGSLSLMSFL